MITTKASVNNDAEGMLIWLPRTNHGPSIFVYNGSLATKPNTWLSDPISGTTLYGAPQAYDRYFT